MSKTFHSRYQPKNMPDDWRDESLYRAATWLNKDADIPAMFPEESLDYLLELGYSLPRRGILFVTSSREFVEQLALGVLTSNDAVAVQELLNIRQRKENAVANGDFQTASTLRDQQGDLQRQIAKRSVHEIRRVEIVDALAQDGVDLEVEVNHETEPTPESD